MRSFRYQIFWFFGRLLRFGGCSAILTAAGLASGAGYWRGFEPAVEYTYPNDSGVDTFSQPSTFLFADFNRDGHIDFMIDGSTYGQSGTGDYIQNAPIFLNQGNGTFTLGKILDKGNTHKINTDAQDFNGDGFPDLLTPYFWGNAFELRRGRTNVHFVTAQNIPTATHGGPTRFHDFDRDGDLDIISLSAGSGNPVRIHFFVNNNGVFQKYGTVYGYATANSPNAFIFYNNLLLGDLNQDGRTDVFLKAMDGSRALTLIQTGTDGFQFVQKDFSLQTGASTLTGGEWFELLDYNQDSYPDLVSTTDNALYIWENNTTGGFPSFWSRRIPLKNAGNRSFFVDVDRDGNLDLVTRSQPDPSEMRLTTYLNPGAYAFELADQQLIDNSAFTDYQGYNAFALHDLNADGFEDMVAVGRDNKVYVYLNGGVADMVRSSPRNIFAYAGNPVTYQISTLPQSNNFDAPALPAWLNLDTDTGSVEGTAPLTSGLHTLSLSAGDGNDSVTFDVSLQIFPSLATALDTDGHAPDQIWQTTGDRPWISQSTETRDGVDAVAAPGLPAGGTSRLETSIIGPKVLSAYWKRLLPSQEVRLLLNGQVAAWGPDVGEEWELVYLEVPEGLHVVSFEFERSQDTPQTVWIDEVKIGRVAITSPLKKTAIAGVPFDYGITLVPGNLSVTYASSGLPEGLSMDPLTGRITGSPSTPGTYAVQLTAQPDSGAPDTRTLELVVEKGISPYLETENLSIVWIPDPTVNWSGQTAYSHDGSDAMQSPNLEEIGYPWVTAPSALSGVLTVTDPCELTFWWRTQTGNSNNLLSFDLNGVRRESHSGVQGWTRSLYLLEPGTHTLTWQYHQGWGSGGELDAVWVDQIELRSRTGSFTAWSSYHNLTGNNGDPGADSDGDSVPNALEYVLSTDPRTPSAGGTPPLKMGIDPERGRTTWTWRQRSGGSGQRGLDYQWQDARITLEITHDLKNGPWITRSDLVEHQVVTHPDGTETVTLITPVQSSGPSVMSSRLRISLE